MNLTERNKKRIFFGITLAVPVLVFLLAEALLRLAGYGNDLALVVRKTVAGREMYCINRAVGRRYFVDQGIVIPEPADNTFEITKRPQTLRIFCLGESTMAGFPYEFNATMPGFLRDRIADRLPGRTIEVINVGLSAVGSFVVEDFLRELLDYEPDCLVLYVGHNEFYGAYGVGSTIGRAATPWLARTSIRLLKSRTYLFLRNLYNSIRPVRSAETDSAGSTLMAQVIGEQEIPYGSPMYLQARSVYAENLERIIALSQDTGVPIVVCTLVSNLKDHPPFRSASEVPPGPKERLDALAAAARDSLRRGHPEAAERAAAAGLSLDSTHAMLWYLRGRSALAGGEIAAARESFLRAKDYDLLRFRATEDFQGDLLTVCRRRNVPVARADSAFAAASADGIPGRELILEHLHPNIAGYFLMAKTVCAVLATHGLGAPAGEWNATPERTDQEYMERSTVSRFDTLLGSIKVALLTRRLPFPNPDPRYVFIPGGPEESIVYDYVRGRLAWSEARYRMAAFYAARRDFARARRECLAVAREAPYSYEPLLRVADYYRMDGKNEEAKASYLRSIQLQDNPFARMKLAYLLLAEERAADAAREIEAAFTLDTRLGGKLDHQSLALGRYLLGVAYAKTGRLEAARVEAERALALEPANPDFAGLLRQIDAHRRSAAAQR